MAKYDIGIWHHKRDIDRIIFSCGCGTVGVRERALPFRAEHKCECCGNTKFININPNGRELHPYVEVLHKDKKGFKLKRTNLSIMVDSEYNIAVKPNMIQVFVYDLANHDVKLYKNGKIVNLNKNAWSNSGGSGLFNDRNYQRFFSGLNDSELLKMISVDGVDSLYKMAWSDLSYTRSSWGDRKLYRGLIKLWNYTYLEILANAGYPNIERFKERRSSYNNTTLNIEGKNPKEIFGLPKFCLKYIREDNSINIYGIKQMREALKKIDGNRFRELLEIVKDEASVKELCNTVDTLIEIHDKYNYNNLKKLTLYLFREVRMTQGIISAGTGATLLRDYIQMSTKLGQEYEKYPKSLKKEHDITMMNYKVKESELKQKEFIESVTSEFYKSFEYKSNKKQFAIVSPNTMNDLIREGNELSHCVASYVESINTKRCQIYFMRDAENLDKSLATIEVRGGNVRQAKGYANRALKQEERDFVKEWAEKKELELNYYY